MTSGAGVVVEHVRKAFEGGRIRALRSFGDRTGSTVVFDLLGGPEAGPFGPAGVR